MIALLLDIDEVLIPGEDGALADPLGGIGAAHLSLQPAHQLMDDPVGDL